MNTPELKELAAEMKVIQMERLQAMSDNAGLLVSADVFIEALSVEATSKVLADLLESDDSGEIVAVAKFYLTTIVEAYVLLRGASDAKKT